jgi:2-methylfumaryl-CoA hydratase
MTDEPDTGVGDSPVPDPTDPDSFGSAYRRAEVREKGNYFEEFHEGQTIRHDPGLRLTRDGAELWTSQTLNHDPAYWRADAARERGFDEPPIHPDYLLACTMGPSVEDLSEKGGYFLGRTDVTFGSEPVYAGTDLRVESEVIATRTSSSRPNYGIVTWGTTSYDADTGDELCGYQRTNMIPRREPATGAGDEGIGAGDAGTEGDDTGNESTDDDTTDQSESATSASEEPTRTGDATDDRPPFVVPEGPHFEDFREALGRADAENRTVAYRHERGRTMDDTLVSMLPLRTLNTARQHHDANAMADSPSGDVVTYGDVTRSIALGHARSDEATFREVGSRDERFHEFVTLGDTVYAFTRVLDATEDGALPGESAVGTVEFEHVAVNQHDRPVYSGRRTAAIRRRDS